MRHLPLRVPSKRKALRVSKYGNQYPEIEAKLSYIKKKLSLRKDFTWLAEDLGFDKAVLYRYCYYRGIYMLPNEREDKDVINYW
jgi:hypothetical protein